MATGVGRIPIILAVLLVCCQLVLAGPISVTTQRSQTGNSRSTAETMPSTTDDADESGSSAKNTPADSVKHEKPNTRKHEGSTKKTTETDEEDELGWEDFKNWWTIGRIVGVVLGGLGGISAVFVTVKIASSGACCCCNNSCN